MKKVLLLGLVVSMLFAGTAYADILPEGMKYVPVCAYFNNTASYLNTIAIYGIEKAPDGSRVDFSSFVTDECFQTSYKFNTYNVYGVTVAHAATISDFSTYDPTTDQEAYITNIQPEVGHKLIPATSNVERYMNEYTIISLNSDEGHLIIEPVKTTAYFVGGTEQPLVTEGDITPIVDVIPPAVDAFTDVQPTNPYYTAIKYLKDGGIVSGYPDGSFKPDNTINRAEFTKIVTGAIYTTQEITNCYLDYVPTNDYNVRLFSDVNFAMVGGNMPEWYFDYVCIAKHNNIVSGYPDGSFMPAQEINFVEGAKIIVEALNYVVTPSTPWYKTYVDTLESNNAIPTTITRFDHKLTRGEMAEIMYRLKATVNTLPSNHYSDLQ